MILPRPRASSRPKLTVVEASGTAERGTAGSPLKKQSPIVAGVQYIQRGSILQGSGDGIIQKRTTAFKESLSQARSKNVHDPGILRCKVRDIAAVNVCRAAAGNPAEAAADRLGVKHRAAVDICHTRILVEQDGVNRPVVLKPQRTQIVDFYPLFCYNLGCFKVFDTPGSLASSRCRPCD